jgi:ADP-ribosylglycohydrolase
VAKWFRGDAGYRLVFGRGMISDDTEHACMTAQSLMESGGEVERFRRRLARRLRWWLAGLPAGTGLATGRAILKLWLGVSPARSGVFSAGNGPAMRSAIIGVACAEAPERLRGLVRASTRLTHTDPKAEQGALVMALAARRAAQTGGEIDRTAFRRELEEWLAGEGSEELLQRLDGVLQSVAAGESTEDFTRAAGMGNGVSGYMYHTIPAVLHAWLSQPRDLPGAVQALIRCGGDTDTTAALAGALVGAGVGPEGIPATWRRGLWEWPRSRAWIEALGRKLARDGMSARRAPGVFPPAVLARNLLFLIVVLAHGLRRLLPPY